MIPVLAPPADDAARVAASDRFAVWGAGRGGEGNVPGVSDGLVSAYRFLTQDRPTWRESVLRPWFLTTTGVTAMGAAAVVIGVRRRRKSRP
jgi:hypothetical protein